MSELDDQAAALRRLVTRLDDTATVLTGVRDAVAGAWDDAAGNEWTGRLGLVRRAAEQLAEDAAAEASALERRAAEGSDTGPHHDGVVEPRHDAGGDPVVGGPGDAGGVLRLPGYGGTRATDRRGMIAPLLPPTDGSGRP